MKIIKSSTLVVLSLYFGLANSQIIGLEKLKSKLEKAAISNGVESTNATTLPGPVANQNPTIESGDEYLISPEELCERVKNPKFKQYVDAVSGIYTTAGRGHEGYNIRYLYDTKDGIVSKWISSVSLDIRKKTRGKEDRIIRSWTDAANKCASTLLNTSAIYLFTTDSHELRILRDKMQDSNKPVASRSLSLNGNIEEQQRTAKTIVWDSLFQSGSNNMPKWNAIPILLAILDKEGKVLNQVHTEIMDAITSQSSRISALKDKSDSAYAEMDKEKKAAEARRIAQDKQQEDIYRRIKGGDLNAAKSCADIFNAVEVDDGLDAALTPHKRLKAGLATLNRYTESKPGIGVMYIIKSGFPAEVRTNSNTLWFDRESIRVGSDVMVIGKYTDNTSIKLTNGTSRQAPVLDAVCIQPM